jgi:hypothetical protein
MSETTKGWIALAWTIVVAIMAGIIQTHYGIEFGTPNVRWVALFVLVFVFGGVFILGTLKPPQKS